MSETIGYMAEGKIINPSEEMLGKRAVELAFPIVINTGGKVITALGLTKRELFTAMALQGLLADTACNEKPENFAIGAVKLADALIAALKEEPK